VGRAAWRTEKDAARAWHGPKRRGRLLRVGLVAAVIAGAVLPRAAAAHDAPASTDRRAASDASEAGVTYAIGVFRPEYVPPPVGSYSLPVIDTVADHPLLDDRGRATSLFAVTRDRLAVLAFVYTTCTEAAGCPASTAVLHGLDRALAADPALARQVVLVSASFDPERDTPEHMAAVHRLHRPRTDWRFVTTRSEADLAPLLADFDQPVAKLRRGDGAWTGLFRHVLKVFLLDREHRVRNVYSAGFLNRALILNDLRTVLLDTAASSSARRDGDAYAP
jgi:cytochrome oxidase Cu insertion factor (SCO1/SenC/PrrC family)